jgi:hypothetical protein
MVQPSCRVRRPASAANPAAVNPPEAGARASGADGAARIRGLLRSLPAILPAPLWAGSGPAFS